jgi:translation initiation factor 1 (eIF-1/SUI1)
LANLSEICSKCGLPKDLCVCEAIVKEQQRIRVFLEKRKWGRDVTIVEGIDEKSIKPQGAFGKTQEQAGVRRHGEEWQDRATGRSSREGC